MLINDISVPFEFALETRSSSRKIQHIRLTDVRDRLPLLHWQK
jgi:hypothetical protein